MNKKKLVIALGVLGVFAVFLGIGLMNKDNIMSTAKTVVLNAKTDAVSTSNITSTVTVKGTLYPVESKKVYSKSIVPIESIKVTEGQIVKKDDVLLTYDETEYDALVNQLEQAEKSLAIQSNASNSSQKQTKEAIDKSKQVMEQMRVVMEQSKRSLETAMEEFNNTSALYKMGAVSKDKMESLGDQVKSLKEKVTLDTTAYTNAKKSYENLLATDSSSSQLQKEIQGLQTSQLATKVEDYDVAVTSPLEGTIITISGEEGAILPQGTKIMEVADLSNYKVKAYITEFDAPSLFVGQEATVTSRGPKPVTFNGKVTFVAPNAAVHQESGSSNKTVKIEVTLTDYDGKSLKPGYTVDTKITLATRENAVTVPILSTIKDQESGNYFVYVVDENNILHKRFVELGIVSNRSVEVSGINEGEIIVVQPNSRLKDEMQILPQPLTEEGEAENND